jgi:chemotaxis protein MotB
MSEEYRDYTISIEGYTDDSPIKTPQFPSNWELSTARAAAVVRSFVGLGVPAERLRAVGFAETSPKLPNRDADGKAIPENQAQNRRVVIRLEKITKQKQN